MNSQMLRETAKLLFADPKGLLAMDESTGTCNKRFAKLVFLRRWKLGELIAN